MSAESDTVSHICWVDDTLCAECGGRSSRCEDYPCCGHTDGLGCNYSTDYYSSPQYHNYINLHYGCDHEAGWCVSEQEETE